MKTEELKQIALAAAKNIKTQQDLAEFQQMLTKVTVEAALNAELDDHLTVIPLRPLSQHEPLLDAERAIEVPLLAAICAAVARAVVNHVSRRGLRHGSDVVTTPDTNPAKLQ